MQILITSKHESLAGECSPFAPCAGCGLLLLDAAGVGRGARCGWATLGPAEEQARVARRTWAEPVVASMSCQEGHGDPNS